MLIFFPRKHTSLVIKEKTQNVRHWWWLFFLFLLAPASPPVDIVTNKISSTAINIKFGLISLNDRNGVIDKYQVLIRQKDVDTTWTTYFVTENDATKTIDIEGLEKWRDYEYVVSGCTIGGCGENSTIAVQRTDEDSK